MNHLCYIGVTERRSGEARSRFRRRTHAKERPCVDMLQRRSDAETIGRDRKGGMEKFLALFILSGITGKISSSTDRTNDATRRCRLRLAQSRPESSQSWGDTLTRLIGHGCVYVYVCVRLRRIHIHIYTCIYKARRAEHGKSERTVVNRFIAAAHFRAAHT